MGQLKDIGLESETSRLCSVTGLPIFGRPEWTFTDIGTDYRVVYTILGDSILLVKSSGHVTLSYLEQVLLLEKKLRAEVFSRGQAYVRVEDWSDLKGISRKTRERYTRYIINRKNLAATLYYNLSVFFKLAVNFGKRFNIVESKLEIVDNYEDAVKRALEILSNVQTGKENFNAPAKSGKIIAQNGQVPSCHKRIIQPEWCCRAQKYTLHFEVINDCILHGIATGRFEDQHISPSMRLHERVIEATGLSQTPYFMVLGLEDSEGTSQSTRKKYVQAIMDLHKKYPFIMFIFYGANRFLKAGINISRPFVPFKVRVVKDLESALNLIDKYKVENSAPASSVINQDTAGKPLSTDHTQQYVNELLKFIGEINWEIDGISEEIKTDHDHPFSSVFDAIKLIKWELDDLWTEQKRIQDELKQAKKAAEDASLAKSDFLANMSHELRTPLNHIIGFTELVVDKTFGDLNEVQEEYLNDVHHSSKHLLSLINDILDLSKVENGKQELELNEVNLKEILGNSLNMIKEKAMKHSIELSPDIDNIPQTIRVDERKLKQVMYNLLSNAVKFTADGGKINLRAVLVDGSSLKALGKKMVGSEENLTAMSHEGNAPEKFVRISVTDSGIGIKQEDLERIFKPFEQGENSASRKYQGTGLGLSLTKNFVELHGGKIWAESEGEGKGSTFNFILSA